MARNQKNFDNFLYVDDNANEWQVRGESGGAGSGVDGHATDYTKPGWGRMTNRRHVRYVVATDPTTYRTIKFIVYTPTAFAAISPGDTIAVQVEGLATTVNYTVSAKIAEKQPILIDARNLPDS